MKHVGICTVDGPEQKTGEIKLQVIGTSRVKATLFVDGVACAYAGRKSDSYSGLLRCQDQRDVPLLMWLKFGVIGGTAGLVINSTMCSRQIRTVR